MVMSNIERALDEETKADYGVDESGFAFICVLPKFSIGEVVMYQDKFHYVRATELEVNKYGKANVRYRISRTGILDNTVMVTERSLTVPDMASLDNHQKAEYAYTKATYNYYDALNKEK